MTDRSTPMKRHLTPENTDPHRARRNGPLAASFAALLIALSGCASVNLETAQSPSQTTTIHAEPATTTTVRSVRPSGPLTAIATQDTSVAPVALLATPSDIWDRIRRGFSMPDLNNDLVRDREQWYSSRPDYIQRMTERSGKYLFHIVEEIERRNMPTELALLPFIESAFNPQAVSSAKAAGMWQFMPATGESFDLKQNVFRDDRRDVLASTKAALDYLQQLHDRFGDWHLALAAYNWGQGNVNRAITRNQREGLATGYTDLSMPAETRLYVPKLQAVKNILSRPENFNAPLPVIGNHPFFETVSIDRDIDVSVIARLANMSEKDFRALNPSLKQPLVMAAGMPNILLPWESATTFTENLNRYDGPLASWTVWVVPTTMSAAQVAERVNMDEGELRSINNIPPRMLVRAGSSLLVPRGGKRNNDVPETVADNGHLSLQPDIVLKRVRVRARKGEDIAQLAQRYGLSPTSVAGWNKASVNTRLKTGQRVIVMLPQKASARMASGSSSKVAVGSKRSKATSSKKTVRTAKKAPSKSKATAKTKSTTKLADISKVKKRP